VAKSHTLAHRYRKASINAMNAKRETSKNAMNATRATYNNLMNATVIPSMFVLCDLVFE
jgi:hypothetical protein